MGSVVLMPISLCSIVHFKISSRAVPSTEPVSLSVYSVSGSDAAAPTDAPELQKMYNSLVQAVEEVSFLRTPVMSPPIDSLGVAFPVQSSIYSVALNVWDKVPSFPPSV